MTDDRWGWGEQPTDPRGFPAVPVPPRDDAPWTEQVEAQADRIQAVPVSEWSAALVDLAVQSTREQSRAQERRRRLLTRSAIVGGVIVVLAVAGGALWFAFGSGDGSSNGGRQTAGSWCATGTSGPVTTVSKGGDQKTPVGAVATFLDAAIDSRNAAAARATMSETAVAPTVGALAQWIATLPPSTDGWCAQITTTESTARLLVTVRVRTETGLAQLGTGDTFYVSAADPDKWTIDAIVAGT